MTTRNCVFSDPHNIERCTECGATIDLCMCVNIDDSAHQRLASPEGIVIAMIRGELSANPTDGSAGSQHLLVSLMQEVGELAQAMIEHDRIQETTVQMVLRKAVQAAAVTIQIATRGDDNFLYIFPLIEEDLPKGPVSDRF